MPITKSQFDFPPISIAELRETLQQALPALERLIQLARTLTTQAIEKPQSLCDSRPKRETCSEPCEKIEKPTKGRNRRENLTGFYDETLQKAIRIRSEAILDEYKKCIHLLTQEQWVAVYLKNYKGLTQEETAGEMGNTTSSVCELLQKAKNTLEEHKKMLRAEAYKIRRKDLSEKTE
jgi:predicted DNA-binding protein (UPF0251 family)